MRYGGVGFYTSISYKSVDMVIIMKKNRVLCCLFVFMMLMVLPVVSSSTVVSEQEPAVASVVEQHTSDLQDTAAPLMLTGYLLIHVSVYTPGEGLHPYMGANISVKGLFYKYNGQTDEKGDCLFQVHTRLLTTKLYIIKVSIPPEDWLHSKINSIYMQSGQIVYKDFLFIVL